jgi:hypothetical protein
MLVSLAHQKKQRGTPYPNSISQNRERRPKKEHAARPPFLSPPDPHFNASRSGDLLIASALRIPDEGLPLGASLGLLRLLPRPLVLMGGGFRRRAARRAVHGLSGQGGLVGAEEVEGLAERGAARGRCWLVVGARGGLGTLLGGSAARGVGGG